MANVGHQARLTVVGVLLLDKRLAEQTYIMSRVKEENTIMVHTPESASTNERSEGDRDETEDVCVNRIGNRVLRERIPEELKIALL